MHLNFKPVKTNCINWQKAKRRWKKPDAFRETACK